MASFGLDSPCNQITEASMTHHSSTYPVLLAFAFMA